MFSWLLQWDRPDVYLVLRESMSIFPNSVRAPCVFESDFSFFATFDSRENSGTVTVILTRFLSQGICVSFGRSSAQRTISLLQTRLCIVNSVDCNVV